MARVQVFRCGAHRNQIFQACRKGNDASKARVYDL